ncbi:Protein IQ-DOMAIN 1 [Bienertia sinuspersici]
MAHKNMGWSWLERWMATRQTEFSSVDDHTTKQQLINNEAGTILNLRHPLKKKFLDLSFDEKESCGSNEVPVQNESSPNPEKEHKDGSKLAKNRLKSPRSISRRKTVPTHHYQKEHSKMTKKDGSKEPEKDRRQRAKPIKQSVSSSVCKDDVSSWFPPDNSVSG